MIRQCIETDIDDIMRIWLDGNIKTHSFVKQSYWKEHAELVKGLMFEADMYVSENQGVITGFIGIMDQIVAGIFVHTDYQNRGIGNSLISEVKRHYPKLMLQVYKKNEKAIKFYIREGFIITSEQFDKSTGEVEFVMEWTK